MTGLVIRRYARQSPSATRPRLAEGDEEVVCAFAEATGTSTPCTSDAEFAKTSLFKERVAHGMLAPVSSPPSSVPSFPDPTPSTSPRSSSSSPPSSSATPSPPKSRSWRRSTSEDPQAQDHRRNQSGTAIIEGIATVKKWKRRRARSRFYVPRSTFHVRGRPPATPRLPVVRRRSGCNGVGQGNGPELPAKAGAPGAGCPAEAGGMRNGTGTGATGRMVFERQGERPPRSRWRRPWSPSQAAARPGERRLLDAGRLPGGPGVRRPDVPVLDAGPRTETASTPTGDRRRRTTARRRTRSATAPAPAMRRAARALLRVGRGVLGGTCLPVCLGERCGADSRGCCVGGFVCLYGGCVAFGAACGPAVSCDETRCGTGEYCEAILGRCLPETGVVCEYRPPAGEFDPEILWEWTTSTVEPDYHSVVMTPAVADLDATAVRRCCSTPSPTSSTGRG